VSKPKSAFGVLRRNAGGLSGQCKDCNNSQNRLRYVAQTTGVTAVVLPTEPKKCSKCGVLKPLTEYYKRDKSGRYKSSCKECYYSTTNEYRDNHRKQVRAAEKIRLDAGYRERKQGLEQERAKDPTWRAHKQALAMKRHLLDPGRRRAHRAKRRTAELQRTPKWLTKDDYKLMLAVYQEAAQLTKDTGVMHHVDHIYPLQGETVSGLHVPTNLQILPYHENLAKGNKFPDAKYT